MSANAVAFEKLLSVAQSQYDATILDPQEQRCYEHNMDYLREHVPLLYIIVQNYDGCMSVVEKFDDGCMNLKYGNSFLYKGSAYEDSMKSVESFLHDPIIMSTPVDMSSKGYASQDSLTHEQNVFFNCIRYCCDRNLTIAEKPKGATLLIIFGCGLGFHIPELMKKLKVRDVVILESEIEFFKQMLRFHDLREWHQQLKDLGGSLTLIIGCKSEDEFCQRVLNIAPSVIYGTVDGAYFYSHYHSPVFTATWKQIQKNLSSLAILGGFFEDELIMMKHFMENARNSRGKKNKYFFCDRERIRKNVPAIIVGSGPSLDTMWPILKKVQENCIIFSCGTALGALLRNGIQPDFHVELENVDRIYDFLSCVTQGHNLEGTTLIASWTVNPQIASLFSDSIFFFRDSVSSSLYFSEDPKDIIFNAVPTVSNTALRFAIGAGFSQIYMAGTDLGSRVVGEHHAKDSVYHTMDHFFDQYRQHAHAAKMNLKATGNFGGEVYTNLSFRVASKFFDSYSHFLSERVGECAIFNLSDGVRFTGIRPMLPEVFQTLSFHGDKKQDCAEIMQSLEAVRWSIPSDCLKVQDLFLRYYDRIEDILKEYQNLKCVQLEDVYALNRQILLLFSSKNHSREEELWSAFHRSSFANLLYYPFSLVQRVSIEDFQLFFSYFLQQMHNLLSVFRAALPDLQDSLRQFLAWESHLCDAVE